MTKKSNNKNIRSKVIKTAMDIAALDGWRAVTMDAIAKKAGISPSVLSAQFKDKQEILTAFGRMVDEQTIAHRRDTDAPVRERLFDILMDRFEILNDYRDGVIAVLNDFKSDPCAGIKSLPNLCESMRGVLTAAGVDADGPAGGARIFGITAVYMTALWAWMDDETPDMAKTMAALDKALSFAERAAKFTSFF